MIYNVHYDVSAMAIALFGILFVWTKKGLHKRQNKILMGLLVSCFFAAFFDITSSIGNSHITNWSFFWRDFHNYAYLTLHNVMPYLVSCYIVALTGMNFGRRKNLFLQRLNIVPVAAAILLLYSNIFTGKVFYYDEQRVYTHGPLFPILFVLAYFYVILCILLLFRFGKNVATGKRRMAYLLLFASLISVAAQMVLPTILLQLCVESLCLLGLVIVVDNEDEVLDAESGCYNRKSFVYDFHLYQHNGTSFPIVIVRPEKLTAFANTIGAVHMGQLKHQLGDFLKSVTRMAECYYVENDTFVMIGNSRCDAKALLEGIKQGFEKEWQVGTYHLKLNAQVYGAQVPEEVKSIDELLTLLSPETDKDNAVEGRSETENAAQRYKREQDIEEAIRRGLQYGTIEIFYQPIWDSSNNQIVSCEALLRLTDEKLGYIPAGTVMHVVSQKGLSRELEEYLMEKVCRFISTHSLKKVGIERVNTNLSRELLLDRGLVAMIDEAVDQYGIPHEQIGFEFSGAPQIRNDETVMQTLAELKRSGYTLIMDRFGAGYTDVMDLADFPISVIKFDGSILKKMITNRRAYTIMTYSIKMSKRLGFTTIAVGVEREEEKDIMLNLGCDDIQGYYFSQALMEEDFYRYSMGFNGK